MEKYRLIILRPGHIKSLLGRTRNVVIAHQSRRYGRARSRNLTVTIAPYRWELPIPCFPSAPTAAADADLPPVGIETSMFREPSRGSKTAVTAACKAAQAG